LTTKVRFLHRTYDLFFSAFFAARSLAHRAFVARLIASRPFAEIRRFFLGCFLVNPLTAIEPKAAAAASSAFNCFSNFEILAFTFRLSRRMLRSIVAHGFFIPPL
jgi:hypothetical protein